MKVERLVERTFQGLLVVAAAYAITRALVLRVDYFDSFKYLINARRLLGDALVYDVRRPPLIPLLQMPVVALARTGAPANLGLLIAPHVLAALLSLASAAAVGVLLRKWFSWPLALVGTVLFVWSRLFVRYGAHVLTDLPVTGLAAATLALALAAHERRRLGLYAVCGLALGAATLARYNIVFLGPLVALLELASMVTVERTDAGRLRVRANFDGRRALGVVVAGAVCIATFLAVELFTFSRIASGRAVAELRAALLYAWSVAGALPGESWRDYGPMLVTALSWPVVILSAAGALLAIARPQRRDVLPWLWLVVIGGPTVLMVGHNEARYLLPLFPAILYFCLRAMEALLALLRSPGRPVRVLAFVVLCAPLLGILNVGGRQVRADRDPVFLRDVERAAIAAMDSARRGEGRRLLLPGWHSLYARTPGPFPADEFWNTFHVAYHVADYLLGTPFAPTPWRNADPAGLRDDLAASARDGDTVLRFDGQLYLTATLPRGRPPAPIQVWAIERHDLRQARPGDPFTGGPFSITVTSSQLNPNGDLNNQWLFVRRRSSPRPVFVPAAAPGQPLPLPPGIDPADIDALILLRVDVSLFS